MKITLNAFGLDITVNLFKGGASFAFTLDGVEYTHGILRQGLHDFGKATRKETLLITTGEGDPFSLGATCVFVEGMQIVIEVKSEWMTYTCRYGDVHETLLAQLERAIGRQVKLTLVRGGVRTGILGVIKGKGWFIEPNAVNFEPIVCIKSVEVLPE